MQGSVGSVSKHYTANVKFNPEGGQVDAGISRVPGTTKEYPNPNFYVTAFEVDLDPSVWGRRRSIHFQRSNMALDEAIQSDAQFAKSMEDLIPGVQTAVGRSGGRETPDGWVWHHVPSAHANGRMGVMRLVPLKQHPKDKSGPWWGVLHMKPGDWGGYSEWAIPNGAPRN